MQKASTSSSAGSTKVKTSSGSKTEKASVSSSKSSKESTKTKSTESTSSDATSQLKLPIHEQKKFLETLTDQEKAVLKGIDLNDFIGYNIELPKRPLSGFFAYSDTIRDKVREEHPELKVTQLGGIFSQRWKALSDAEREKFNKASQEAQEKYKVAAAKQKYLADIQERCLKFYKDTLGIVDFPIVDGVSWETSLAQAGVKRLMSLDPDMSQIAKDAVALTGRATEAFIVYLGKCLADHLRKSNKKRKTLTLQLLVQMIFAKKEFEFLRTLPILSELKQNKNLLKDNMGDDDDESDDVNEEESGSGDSKSQSSSSKLQKLQMKNDQLQEFLKTQKQLPKFVTSTKGGSDARDIFDDITPDDGVQIKPAAPIKKTKAPKKTDTTTGDKPAVAAKEKKESTAVKPVVEKKKAVEPKASAAATTTADKPTKADKPAKAKTTSDKPKAASTSKKADDEDDEDLFDAQPFTPKKDKSKEKKRRRSPPPDAQAKVDDAKVSKKQRKPQ